MTELPSEEAVETVDENGWTHRRCEGSVPENSKVVGGVLCRYWHEEEPEGVRLINSLDQVAPLLARIAELEKHWNWIKQKLGLSPDAEWGKVYGEMHVKEANAHGYVAYIESYKCDDKQGEIARLTVERNRLKEENEKLQGINCCGDTTFIAMAKQDHKIEHQRLEIERLEGELVKRGDLLDEVLKDAVDAQKRLEAELVEARRVTDLLNTQNVLLMERATVKEGSQ